MISYVAQLLNLFARTVLYTVHIASLIGKIIIISISWISSTILKILSNIFSFFQIVYEDNVLMFTEVPNSVHTIADTFYNQIYGIWKIVATLYHNISKQLTVIVITTSQLIDTILLIIHDVVAMLMKIVLFLGESIWLIITFVPVHLPQLLKTIFKSIIDSTLQVIINSYMALLKLTNFLTEVPLESFMGLTFAIVIVRLCIHFRINIHTQIILLYWSMKRNFLYLYHMFYNYVTNSEIRVISRVASGQELRTRDIHFEAENTDANQTDSLCVICQERLKCVLVLPCRHICLCAQCCRQLYEYQRTCPICRTFIYHSVTVYL